MKKRIRKTGEIVEVIAYCAPLNEIRADGDWVSYIDSGGFERPCCTGLNIYWDFENVEEVLSNDIDWKQMKIKAAISALQGFAASPQIASTETLARWSIDAADALITELKKTINDETEIN